MKHTTKFLLTVIVSLMLGLGNRVYAELTVNSQSVPPGTEVTLKGTPMPLYDGSIAVGDDFSAIAGGTDIDFDFKNKVTIVSIVPSIDTPVCEAQTHALGESQELGPGVDLVTISRDLPPTQSRFAKEAKLENIRYYSDYKTASFGKRTGLLIHGKELLARAVLVLDADGIVRYIQVVPELTNLPDLEAAIRFANRLAAKKTTTTPR